MIPFKLNINKCNVKYTDVYTVSYQKYGTLYCFNARVFGNGKDLCFRITSKSQNFHDLFSVDVLSKKHRAVVGVRFKSHGDSDAKTAAENAINYVMSGKKPVNEGLDASSAMKLFTMFISVVAVLSIVRYYVTEVIKWFNEKLSDSVYENQVNKKLFEGQNGKEPEFQIYNKLINSIEMIIHNDKIKSVLVCGIPGTSKTHVVRRTLYFNNLTSGTDYVIVKGSSMTMYDFVSCLYENKDKIVVLDDFDSPLNDTNLVNILKSATDSYSKRIISVPRAKMIGASSDSNSDYKIPQKFEFTGKLIIITNKKFKEIDKAFISRCLTIEVNFTPEEFISTINSMLKYIMPDIDMNIKLEVFRYVEKLSKEGKLDGLNFRTFQNAISIRLLYPESWKDMVAYVLK